jgi:hypothetical protein
MGEQVQVDLTALTTFANTLGKLADDHVDTAVGYGGDVYGLALLIATQTATAAEFLECQAFVAYHEVAASSAQHFLIDVLQGVSSLGAGAEVVAINYAGADQFNAAKLQQLSDELKAGGHFATMDFILHGNATVSSGDVNDAFAPTGDQGLWSSGKPGAPPPGMSQADIEASDKAFQAQIDQDRQLILNGQQADLKTYADQSGKPFTFGQPAKPGHTDTTITVPGDANDLTPTKPDTLSQGW